MSTYEVTFYEAFEEEAEALKKHCPSDCQARFTWKTVQESGDQDPPSDIISTRTQSVIPHHWAPALKGILSRSTGYDHLASYRDQVQECPALGYLPLYCNRAVAEQAMLMWMALLRRLPRQMCSFARFERDGLTGAECRGKTLLVVGVGNIGHEIIDIGRGLGMQTLGVDPVRRWRDVHYVGFHEGAPQADVVVAAMNLTNRNHGYFDHERLRRLKYAAILINVARGELVALDAVVTCLQSGQLGGVALDVFESEAQLGVALRAGKPLPDSLGGLAKLQKRENAILTPHNAFNTVESVERKAAQSMEQVMHLVSNGAFKWRVPTAQENQYPLQQSAG